MIRPIFQRLKVKNSDELCTRNPGNFRKISQKTEMGVQKVQRVRYQKYYHFLSREGN